MEKGNKSQMPTDIHKHMAHTTDLALYVCVFPAVIHKGFRCDSSDFPVAMLRQSPGNMFTIHLKYQNKTGINTHTLMPAAAYSKRYHGF